MFFTLFYMYATLSQWWRLGALKNKLRGTLNGSNALLVCSGNAISFDSDQRSLENLLYHRDDKFACTVVPRQRINLSSWVVFPRSEFNFPIQFVKNNLRLYDPKLFLMITTHFEKFLPHQAEIIELERFGELIAWKLNDFMNIIVKTDMDNVTKLVHFLSNNDVDINHELKVVKIETVDVQGSPSRVKFNKIFPSDVRLKYSVDQLAWNEFVKSLKEIYSKLNEKVLNTNPKIMIENGSKSKLPISEVKPIKKESSIKHETTSISDKDTLEVCNKRSKTKSSRDRSKSKEEKRKSHHQNQSINREKLDDDDVKKKSGKKRTGTLKKMNSLHEDDDPNLCLAQIDSKRRKESLGVLSEVMVKFPSEREITRQNSNTKRNTKPPNVLVYGDSLAAKENVKNVLGEILNKERYTIYDLPLNKPCDLWDDSTTLVVICGNVTPTLTHELLQYLVNGGQLLCLCSDLLYSVLQTFSTAEVREHELVRFSYSDWKQIKMMHHIFCYQASPAKKQFSKDSDHSNHSSGDGGAETSSPIAPRTPSTVEIVHNGVNYTVQVKILGTEETWQTPSLLLATIKNGAGRAIFSQVHLEVDPDQYQDDESKYEALKESNSARLDILKHILTNELGVNCDDAGKSDVKYTEGYFLGRHDMKLQMLKENENVRENRLNGEKLSLIFCWKDDEPGHATSSRLPIMVLSCPSNFSTIEYFETLNTKEIGRLVIYSDVLTSSQDVLSQKLVHGLVVIPRQQTSGVGRSQNVWLSPLGSAMFSLQLHIDLNGTIGKSLPLMQHIVMVAIVSALRSQVGYERLEIGLKWPNDLYSYSKIKIGGLIVNTQVYKDLAVLNVGCGVNLDNSNPTTCINDIIDRYNKDFNTQLPKIPFEKYFALVFNELERILNVIDNQGNMDYFYELYYKYWLHNDAEIAVRTEDNHLRKVKVIGIDNFGYLRVKSKDGVSSVQPDGNSFDMLKGLIAPKIR
ncbi:biotin--protein ligase [Onthophagus taurus]|uniref:biotin--protein ligase n=1 Tax=Onthophagus taurus TaxID=166361 RepID=UPI0039BE4205